MPTEFKRRGGRKEIILPRGPSGLPAAAEGEPKAQPNRPLVVALARAHRWQRMIEIGEVPGIELIAAQHGVDRACVSRILGLAMLAPDLTEATLKGNEPAGLSLAKLHRDLPIRWDEQRRYSAK